MKEEGIVASIENGRITVETVPHTECKGCKSCGASRSRHVVVDESYEGLKEGDRVEVEIDPSVMFKLYMLLYAVPLLVFILAILAVYSVWQNPPLSFAIAIIFTGITFLGIGKHIKKKKEFSPKLRKLSK